jgi:lysophospholipid acyltransferase (LPLAT)-like uncharacterized protein
VPSADEPRRYTLRQRLMLWLAPSAANLLIRLIGRTLRLRLALAPSATPDPPHDRTIYCMWHQCVLAAAYAYRNRGMRIMISRSFDGELIARTAKKLGYIPVRGSSSRGGAGALLALHDEVQQGAIAVFTADGPRGPRYVAKPGPVLLARNTGAPIVAFHVALERAWMLRSWDALIIPKPFSRGVIYAEAPLMVPANANDKALQECVAELQRRLDSSRTSAEKAVASKTFNSSPPVP